MMLPSKKERHVAFLTTFLASSLPGSSQHSWASLGQARFVEVGSMRRSLAHMILQTTLLNVLAERQAAGVVHGERLVNGYPLPSDFQAQT
jgi:hypothetical protein